jgi:DNA-binding MarR family transcriptional regulator
VNQLHNDEASTTDSRGLVLERLFELGVLLVDSMDRGLAERSLTRARAELIWRLRREGPQTQRALSQLLQCTPRNVTGLVDALEAAGFVERGPHPSDRRATVVSLTRKGSAATARMEAEYQEAAKVLFADVDPAELDAFSSTLDRILAQLHRSPVEASETA